MQHNAGAPVYRNTVVLGLLYTATQDNAGALVYRNPTQDTVYRDTAALGLLYTATQHGSLATAYRNKILRQLLCNHIRYNNLSLIHI